MNLFRNEDLGKLILRLAIGGLMLFHGFAKLDPAKAMGTAEYIGAPAFLGFGLYLTEFLAPIFIVLGYKTRLSSLVYFSGTWVIVFIAHAKQIGQLGSHGGWAVELPMLYLTGSLALAFLGGGKYSIEKEEK